MTKISAACVGLRGADTVNTMIRKNVDRLEAYVPGEQPVGTDVIKLNTNENPYPPSSGVLKALARVDGDLLRRYPPPACSPLKKRLAELHGCREENVFVGNGSDEVLALCTRAFVENEGTIGYMVPSYSLYPVLADIRGVRKAETELGPDFAWRKPRSGVGVSLFFLTTPHAPTGMLYARADVVNLCETCDGVVVLDEAYADFSREHFMDLALEHENVLVVRSLSKSYSLAGLRVGYAVGPEALVEALCKIKDSYNVSAVAQTVALAAVEDQAGMRRHVEKVRATRERLASRLRALGYTVFPSETNFLWVRPGGTPAKDFFSRLRECGIVVRYFPGARTGEFVRISVGTDRDVDTLLDVVEGKLGDRR